MLTSGTDLKSSQYFHEMLGIPYITGASNITHEGGIIVDRYTSEKFLNSTKGDILLTCKGTVGKLAKNNIGGIHVARQFMAIKGFIFNDFLMCYLRANSDSFKAEAKSFPPGIDKEQVLCRPIALPPLAEQTRIVNKIIRLSSLLSSLICPLSAVAHELGQPE